MYMSPSHAIFFAWTGAERPSSVDWCGASLALAWSPKNGEVFRIGRDAPSPLPFSFLFFKIFVVVAKKAPWEAATTTTAARGGGLHCIYVYKYICI